MGEIERAKKLETRVQQKREEAINWAGCVNKVNTMGWNKVKIDQVWNKINTFCGME